MAGGVEVVRRTSPKGIRIMPMPDELKPAKESMESLPNASPSSRRDEDCSM